MAIRAVVFDIGGVLEITPEMTFARRWEAELGLPPGAVDHLLADVWAAGAIGTITEEMVHQAISDRLGLAMVQRGRDAEARSTDLRAHLHAA